MCHCPLLQTCSSSGKDSPPGHTTESIDSAQQKEQCNSTESGHQSTDLYHLSVRFVTLMAVSLVSVDQLISAGNDRSTSDFVGDADSVLVVYPVAYG